MEIKVNVLNAMRITKLLLLRADGFQDTQIF